MLHLISLGQKHYNWVPWAALCRSQAQTFSFRRSLCKLKRPVTFSSPWSWLVSNHATGHFLCMLTHREMSSSASPQALPNASWILQRGSESSSKLRKEGPTSRLYDRLFWPLGMWWGSDKSHKLFWCMFAVWLDDPATEILVRWTGYRFVGHASSFSGRSS